MVLRCSQGPITPLERYKNSQTGIEASGIALISTISDAGLFNTLGFHNLQKAL